MDEVEVFATALGSAPLVTKILGPTADYIGGEVRDFTQKRLENLFRIFNLARRRLGDRLEDPGGVSPRVLKGIFDVGSFCDEQVAAEYIGGVLANSRSGLARDDRGVFWLDLIGRLSSYQLRQHYVCYRLAKTLLSDTGVRTWNGDDLENARIFIPVDECMISFELGADESHLNEDLLSHTISGIRKEGLLGLAFGHGSSEAITPFVPLAANFELEGVVYSATTLGIQLYQWAAGLPGDTSKFCQQEDFTLEEPIPLPESAKLVSTLNVELAQRFQTRQSDQASA